MQSELTKTSSGSLGERIAIALLLVAMLVCLWAPVSRAQLEELRLPISLDADSTDYDGNNSMLMFQGLRLTQGNIGVEADEGRASKLDFEDSIWHFAGNVIIDTENGHIECDAADLRFDGHQLQTATITGSPATFELRRPGNEEITYAEAGRLDYDFRSGIIEFSEQAVITEGGNQISSNYLLYNITERRINAQSAGEGDPKVKITYTPKPEEEADTDDEAETEADDAAIDETDDQ